MFHLSETELSLSCKHKKETHFALAVGSREVGLVWVILKY